MVQEIPKFRSTSVTQTPSMGIVSQTGTRAAAQAVADVAIEKQAIGNMAGQLADYAGQKADQFAARYYTQKAQDDVRRLGLDPADIPEPLTQADRIYREAALKTYSINMERDIEENLSRLARDNEGNPEAYRKLADAFIKGKSSQVAPELRNAAMQIGNATITRNYARMDADRRSKQLAEAKRVEQSRLMEIKAQIQNAPDDEMKQYYFAQANALLDNSTEFFTDDAREKAKVDFANGIIIDNIKQQVFDGEITPQEAADKLRGIGVAVDLQVRQELTNLANGAINRANAKEAELVRQQAQQNKAVIESYYGEVAQLRLSGTDLSIDEAEDKKNNLMSDLIEQGAPPSEALAAADKFERYINLKSDHQETVTNIKEMVMNGDPRAMEAIQAATDAGHITPETRLSLLEDATKAKIDPMDNPIVIDAWGDAFPKILMEDRMSLSDERKEIYDQQRQYYNEMMSEAARYVEEGRATSLADAASQLGDKYKRHTQRLDERMLNLAIADYPVNIRQGVRQELASDMPRIRVYDASENVPAARESSLSYGTLSSGEFVNPDIAKEIEMYWGEGRWTEENKAQRLAYIMLQVDRFFADPRRKDSQRPPYQREEIEAWAKSLGLYDQDLELQLDDIYGN